MDHNSNQIFTSLISLFSIDQDKFSKQVKDIGNIKHDEGETKELKSDYVLGFFGLIMQLGPILNWGLNINKKKF